MLNWAHVHLILNHFPVIGVLGALLVFGYGLVRRSDEVKLLGLGLFVLIALITIPVFLTGGAAENVVKNLPGVTESFIGTHEEMAMLALILMELLGVIAVGGLFLFRKSGGLPQWYITLVLVVALAAAGVVGLTANLGGQIRHTEIREMQGPGSGVQGPKT
jgi:hypothetical protein